VARIKGQEPTADFGQTKGKIMNNTTPENGLNPTDSSNFDRRRFLQTASLLVFGGAATALIATQSDAAASKKTTTTAKRTTPKRATTSMASTATTLVKATNDAANVSIPSETGGPFPGDGSNGANVLTQKGVVRRDIRSSFGASTTIAVGVPLTLKLVVRNASTAQPLVGAAIYVWHCDANGNYSMYSNATVGENYLRGVQETDSSGAVTFSTIFPAAYSGRWPHVHFEIYPKLTSATLATNALKTSQLAFPEDVCQLVYADGRYPNSASNLSRTALASDMVFRDGWSHQLATMTGDVASGFTAGLTFAV
jgi:protocatechuate 3,4-dioxygenase beta subunit